MASVCDDHFFYSKVIKLALHMLQVLSQVLVPPLVQEYAAVKKEWMKQKLWKQEDFIEVLDESCSEETSTKIVEAVHTFLEM